MAWYPSELHLLLNPATLCNKTGQPKAVCSFRKANGLLADLEWKLGQVLHVVAPTLWVKLTRRAQVPGFEGEGHFVRASLVHDLCRNFMVPQLQAVRQVAQGRRLVANMDIIGEQYTVAVGQRLPLINLTNKLGFREASFSPELQVGVDMRAMAPTVKVLVSDDDYKGVRLSCCVLFSFHCCSLEAQRPAVGGDFTAACLSPHLLLCLCCIESAVQHFCPML